jgi:putative aldouronate transport system substrate-binding protein
VEAIDYTIRILTVSHSGELIATDHPAIRQLEELTGYSIELEMILNANFEEQMNLRLAAQDLPGIVVITGNTLPIVQAAQGGAFWDLTDHIPQWPYLAQANPAVLNNISIGGRIFGVYRQRPVGRPGMVYRSDWLEYLNLPVPSTLAELESTLIAFTTNDPQPNGGNTYGMAWTGGHMGPFHDLAVMHGAPNRWEVVNGNFVPWFEHPAFLEAMEMGKRLFDAGAINPDFAALPTGEWALQFGAGLTGWHMDVSDEARRSANRLRDNGFMTQEELDAGEMVWVMGTVANAAGQQRIRAHAGHAGYVAISTMGAPNETSLAHHLNFLNALNSPMGQIIVSHGAEDYNWEWVGDRIRLFTGDEIADGNQVVEGLNQFMMRNANVPPLYGVNSREDAITAVQLANIPLGVHDPTMPLVTAAPTWVAQSASLNRLIDDAVINYIMGNIDRAGFNAEVARWYAEGGQSAIEEFNAAYAAAR